MGNITEVAQKKIWSLISPQGFFLFIMVLKHNIIEQNLYLYKNHFLSSEAPRLFLSVTPKLKVSKSDKVLSFEIHTYIRISEYV